MENKDAQVLEYGPVYYILPWTIFFCYGNVYLYLANDDIHIKADEDWQEMEDQLFAVSQGWA